MTQDTALEILKLGASVFLTGEPGSGKTHTINRYIQYLRQRGVEPAVTASTGIAATHIGGMTIHSWSGIGARSELSEWELEELTQKEAAVKRVNATSVLIVEEVSMLDARLLDSLDAALRLMRRSDKPFGGMQVVLVGDFFQLPPVSRGQEGRFAFQARAWERLRPVVCYLTEQYRQEDPEFLEVLSALRRRRVEKRHRQALEGRVAKEAETSEHSAITRLYSHNSAVDSINARELERLAGEKRSFEMTGKGRKNLVESLKRGCMSPERLELKISAAVMFTKNHFEWRVVNGTLGVVSSFSAAGYPVVELKDGRTITAEELEWSVEEGGTVKAKITQVPLRLAWAITTHKSQGMSLDAAWIDLSQAFEYGQGYVALSRVRSLQGLYLEGFNERALEVHPEVADRDRQLDRYSAAAEKRLRAMEEAELRERQSTFLAAIGGSEEPAATGRRRSSKKQPGDTWRQTNRLLSQGMTASEAAKERGLTVSTILSHIEKLSQAGELQPTELLHLWDETERSRDELTDIQEVFRTLKTDKLTPVMKRLRSEYSFDELRLARALMEN